MANDDLQNETARLRAGLQSLRQGQSGGVDPTVAQNAAAANQAYWAHVAEVKQLVKQQAD
jgi:hypothetical protein